MPTFIAPNGKFYTRQLFWEEWLNIPIEGRAMDAPYTLHKDKPGMINFGREYVNQRDPTGYKMSELYLASYNHWLALMSCRWFVAAKEVWDRELDAIMRKEGLDKIRIMLEEGQPAQQLAAAKYLANMEYKKDKTASKGRPSKAEVDRAARDMAVQDRDVAADLERIRATH